jgi:hypothetical protein
MTTLAEIAAQLSEPFALEDIDFLPKGKIERDGKTLCMALPYADPRVYQDRLNAIAYGEWSTPAPVVIVAGNKLICYVTVILCGVPHTDVGEANNNEENTGTEAFAQAFKRACSQFGLGRYLYNLEKEWVPFKVEGKSGRIDLDKAGKAAIVRKMYQKAGIPLQIHQPVQATNLLEAPNPWDLQKWFKGIHQTIQTAQERTFPGQPIKNTDDLTPKECLALKQTYDGWKRTYDERQRAS